MSYIWHKSGEKPIGSPIKGEESSVSVITRSRNNNTEHYSIWCHTCRTWHSSYEHKVYEWRYMNEQEWNEYYENRYPYVNPDEGVGL